MTKIETVAFGVADIWQLCVNQRVGAIFTVLCDC